LVPVQEPDEQAKIKKVRRSPYADLEEDPELRKAISIALPARYHFEVPKTIWKLRKAKARHVGLQMPDGLLQWATQIAEILKRFGPPPGQNLVVTIMGDVNFGACCIDDIGGAAVGVDFLVHYGHSCLIPVDQTVLKTMYVFVHIDIDLKHLVETIKCNFKPDADGGLSLMGTVQFNPAVAGASAELREAGYDIRVPQAKPLSQGEVLGCTAPRIHTDVCVHVSDGRFHLEALMIQNRDIEFYRYDPYTQVLTTETMDFKRLEELRSDAIAQAREAKVVGLILGTLGRQGSVGVLEGVRSLFKQRNIETIVILLSEITIEKLRKFPTVDAWVQIACPRLSIDWGHMFDKPLLSSYEAHAMFDDLPAIGPMDYYDNKAGPWGNYGVAYGGSLNEKFWHLSRKAQMIIEYDE